MCCFNLLIQASSSIVETDKNLKAFVFFAQEGLGVPECKTPSEFGPAIAKALNEIRSCPGFT